jgi:hypothetical protein
MERPLFCWDGNQDAIGLTEDFRSVGRKQGRD